MQYGLALERALSLIVRKSLKLTVKTRDGEKWEAADQNDWLISSIELAGL